jgi:hypothetical protein
LRDSIARVPVNLASNPAVGQPGQKKPPAPVRLYTPTAVGNTVPVEVARKKSPPAGPDVVTKHPGLNIDPAVPNMKQPADDYINSLAQKYRKFVADLDQPK